MLVGQHFGLKKINFALDPHVEADIFVERERVRDLLVSNLRKAILSNSRFAYVLYGPPGGGKTHCLSHLGKKGKEMALELGQKLDCFYIKCPPLSEEDSVLSLYRAIIEKMSFEFFRKFSQVTFDHQDLNIAFSKISLKPRLMWKWLKGELLSDMEKNEIGLLDDNSTPTRALETFKVILETASKTFPQKPLFLLDDLEEIKKVHSVGYFFRLLRDLADEAKVVLAINGDAFITLDESVQTCIGVSNFIALNSLSEKDCIEMIKQLVSELRKPSIALDILLKKAGSTTTERVSPEYYPFTVEAVETISKKSIRLPFFVGRLLTNAAENCVRDERVIITKSDVQNALVSLFEKVMFHCPFCRSFFRRIDVSYQKSGAIYKFAFTCPNNYCERDIKGTLSNFYRFTLDTNSLVNHIPSQLIYQKIIINPWILIPKEVLGEIQHWEDMIKFARSKGTHPHPSLEGNYKEARKEIRYLAELLERKEVNSIDYLGRKPTDEEIKKREIDYRIAEISTIYQTILITSDTLLANLTQGNPKALILFFYTPSLG